MPSLWAQDAFDKDGVDLHVWAVIVGSDYEYAGEYLFAVDANGNVTQCKYPEIETVYKNVIK